MSQSFTTFLKDNGQPSIFFACTTFCFIHLSAGGGNALEALPERGLAQAQTATRLSTEAGHLGAVTDLVLSLAVEDHRRAHGAAQTRDLQTEEGSAAGPGPGPGPATHRAVGAQD